ncbi:MAG: HPr kinase/phosphatase C-terminal domain-containing protein [Novosphingobium sp.]
MSAEPRQSTCVAIDDRAILIEGAPGSGKSSLALALIDRGAMLVGDDSVMLETRDGRLFASPHPRTRGLLEVRNLGLIPHDCSENVPVALVLHLDTSAPRYIESAENIAISGVEIPLIRVVPHDTVLAIKAELALKHYGLPG